MNPSVCLGFPKLNGPRYQFLIQRSVQKCTLAESRAGGYRIHTMTETIKTDSGQSR